MSSQRSYLLGTARSIEQGPERLPPGSGRSPVSLAPWVRHQPTVFLGLTVCAVLPVPGPSRRSRNGSADAGQETREVRAVSDVTSCESTFRHTLQNLDVDALDDVAA